MADKKPKLASPDWKARIVRIFGSAEGPMAELFGILQDNLRIARYKKRIDHIKKLEEEGYLDSGDKSLHKALFDGTTDKDAEK